MDVPSFLDEDVIYSLGYWLLTGVVVLAFLLGFKLAEGGLFGVATGADVYEIPLLIKGLLIVLTPVIAYIVYGKVALR